MTVTLESELRLHPQVALRPEPFGALAYHYGNRRLVFLKHPDVVSVVKELESSGTVAGALVACGVAEPRWPTFVKALDSLHESDVVCERAS